MPRHIDTTSNVDRTREELEHIGYSVDEVDVVPSGYPALDRRLYIPLGQEIEVVRATISGYQINRWQLPAGYDATHSLERQHTLDNFPVENMLYGAPDPDLPTGGDWMLSDDTPSVQRAIMARCRDFTQHNQPLVPGWRQLLALRSPDDGTPGGNRPLGMPTGIGWYTHYGLSPMCDAVTMRLSEKADDLEVLLYQRSGDNQSEWVWATPGGYVVAADAQVAGITPLQAASARRTEFWTGRNVTGFSGLPLRSKYPISSGNTLVGGLATQPFGRFNNQPDYSAEPTAEGGHRPVDDLPKAAGYVSLNSLCKYNPEGGVSGQGHEGNPFPIWTTHFEYVAAGVDALIDPENQYRLGMSDRQFAQVQEVTGELRRKYSQL